MDTTWQKGFRISVRLEDSTVTISANKAGLHSLASILNTLAQEQPGSHIHLDEYNSLEEHSAELIIEQME